MPPKKVLTIAEHAQKFHVQCCHFLTLLQQEGLQQVGSLEKVQGLLETLAVDFDLQRKGKQTKKAPKEPVAPEVPNSETVDKAARAAQLFGDVDGI